MIGLELLRQMRMDHLMTPFVLVNAHFSEELQAEARHEGALAAISKPLNAIRLCDLLHSVLKER